MQVQIDLVNAGQRLAGQRISFEKQVRVPKHEIQHDYQNRLVAVRQFRQFQRNTVSNDPGNKLGCAPVHPNL